jgi:hypothetical protein
MLVAAVLAVNHFYAMRMIFVEHGIVEYQAAARRLDNISFYMFPNNFHCKLIAIQEAFHSIVAEARLVVSIVSHRIIDLGG